MIYKVTKNEQLNTCLNIIHKSFQTVADDMKLTKENCPSHTAYMSLENLQNQYKNGNPMSVYEFSNSPVGYFSLSFYDNIAELKNLSVLPEYRHLNIGKELVNYAVDYTKKH